MLTLLPPPTWAEIQAKIEDLPPPIAAFALRFLNTAHPMPDAALILADAADEAARELDAISHATTNDWRALANLAREAAPLFEQRAAA
ncbi:MAG: hypothetical protein ACK5X3_08010 [Pseudomonadota bacterium]